MNRICVHLRVHMHMIFIFLYHKEKYLIMLMELSGQFFVVLVDYLYTQLELQVNDSF